MITPNLIVSLLLILSAAWFLGTLFKRAGLPALLGELLAGVILGPPLLGIVSDSSQIELLAELGIFFVMFHTGMELDPRELIEHLWPSLSVAVGGFVLPFAVGYITARLFGGTLHQSLFIGLGVSISAIAVQAVILNSMRIGRSEVGHVIIGAAVANEILALIALSALLGISETGELQIRQIGLLLLKVTAFFAGTILIGHFVLPRFTRRLTDEGGKAFTFAMTSALVMAYLAELAGLHLIIGAFLAGQFVREEILDDHVYEAIHDRFYGISYGFLLPVFFASLAFHLHLRWSGPFLAFAAVLILVAVFGKLAGCALGAAAFGYGARRSVVIGLGMNGRGAVDLVVATVVLNASNRLMGQGVLSEPLLTSDQFSGLVLMAFVTTLIAPISLKWAVVRTCRSDEQAAFCELWEQSKK